MRIAKTAVDDDGAKKCADCGHLSSHGLPQALLDEYSVGGLLERVASLLLVRIRSDGALSVTFQKMKRGNGLLSFAKAFASCLFFLVGVDLAVEEAVSTDIFSSGAAASSATASSVACTWWRRTLITFSHAASTYFLPSLLRACRIELKSVETATSQVT